jgi:hypothetical protein
MLSRGARLRVSSFKTDFISLTKAAKVVPLHDNKKCFKNLLYLGTLYKSQIRVVALQCIKRCIKLYSPSWQRLHSDPSADQKYLLFKLKNCAMVRTVLKLDYYRTQFHAKGPWPNTS